MPVLFSDHLQNTILYFSCYNSIVKIVNTSAKSIKYVVNNYVYVYFEA